MVLTGWLNGGRCNVAAEACLAEASPVALPDSWPLLMWRLMKQMTNPVWLNDTMIYYIVWQFVDTASFLKSSGGMGPSTVIYTAHKIR